MSNQLPAIKEYSIVILTDLLDIYSPPEKPYAEPFLEIALKSDFAISNGEEKRIEDNPNNIGSPDLWSSLLIPIVIETVKVIVLPYFKNKKENKKKKEEINDDEMMRLKIKELLDKRIRKNPKKIDTDKLAREIRTSIKREYAKRAKAIL